MTERDEELMQKGIAEWKKSESQRLLAKAVHPESSASAMLHEAARERMTAMGRARAKKPARKLSTLRAPVLNGNRAACLEVMEMVAAEVRASASGMVSRSRDRRLVRARHIVMLLLARGGWPTTSIGRGMQLHHTTIVHGLKLARRRRDAGEYPEFETWAAKVRKILSAAEFKAWAAATGNAGAESPPRSEAA